MDTGEVLYTYTEAAFAFLQAAEWLDDTHAPMITSLVAIAKQIDETISDGKAIGPGIQAEFTKCHLRLSRPKNYASDEGKPELTEEEQFIAELAALK